MPKTIIGIVSEIAAGKTSVTQYLQEKYGAVCFRFSDMLRDILRRLYLPESRTNMQTLSTILRQNFGQEIMSRVICQDIKQTQYKLIVTEGVRRVGDIINFKKIPHFYLLAIVADPQIRYERLTKRSENPDDQKKTWEEFRKDSQKEAEQQIKQMISQADFTINNNGTFKKLYQQIDGVINEIHNLDRA